MMGCFFPPSCRSHRSTMPLRRCRSSQWARRRRPASTKECRFLHDDASKSADFPLYLFVCLFVCLFIQSFSFVCDYLYSHQGSLGMTPGSFLFSWPGLIKPDLIVYWLDSVGVVFLFFCRLDVRVKRWVTLSTQCTLGSGWDWKSMKPMPKWRRSSENSTFMSFCRRRRRRGGEAQLSNESSTKHVTLSLSGLWLVLLSWVVFKPKAWMIKLQQDHTHVHRGVGGVWVMEIVITVEFQHRGQSPARTKGGLESWSQAPSLNEAHTLQTNTPSSLLFPNTLLPNISLFNLQNKQAV